MHLTSIHDQYRKGHPGELDSSLMITVEYNPKTQEVDGIITVHAYDYKTKAMIDISQIMILQFGDQFEKMMETINWPEIYAEEMANKKEVVA